MESGELKAHLKTTGILFKGVKSEISKITDQVGSIKDYVDSSIGRMITKTQAATIISNQQDLQKSQKLIQDKMEAMESKFDLLLSTLLNADAKKGEKALVTKCGPELKSTPDDREGGEGGGSGKDKAVATATTAAVQQSRQLDLQKKEEKEVKVDLGRIKQLLQQQLQLFNKEALQLDPQKKQVDPPQDKVKDSNKS